MSDETTVAEAAEQSEVAETDVAPETAPDDGAAPDDAKPEEPTDLNAQDDDDDDDASNEGEGEDDGGEVIELDFGGDKLQVEKTPETEKIAERVQQFAKGLQQTVNKRQAELEERTTALQKDAETVQRLSSLNAETLNAYSAAAGMKQQLEAYDAIDWNALWQSEPDQARQLSDQKSALQTQFQNAANRVTELETGLQKEHSEQLERRRQAGREALNKYQANFGNEIAPRLVDYVVQNYGLTKADAENWDLNPAITQMAHKAMLYDEMRKAPAKPKPQPKPEAQKPVKAVPRTGKSGGHQRDPEKMSDAEFRKALGIRDYG